MSISFNPHLSELDRLPVALVEDGRADNIWVTYEEFVCNLVKDMGSRNSNITHMALGIAGESGELVDAIKKTAIYGKELDHANVVEELGDLEFYMAGLRQMLGITRYQVLQANIDKLRVRYAAGYSDAAAIARADKEVEGAYSPRVGSLEEADSAEHTPGQAINLSETSVAGMDDTAGLDPIAGSRHNFTAHRPV